MSWLQKLLPPKIQRGTGPRKQVPEGLWTKCPACSAVLYSTDLEKNLNVCPKCGDHQRIGARARLDGLLDPEGRFEIGAEVLPADFMLRQLGQPLLHATFQFMIFIALLQSGVSSVHAINERIAGYLGERHQKEFSAGARFACTAALLVIAIFAAQRFGLVGLIAKGYRLLALMILITFVLPLLTLGVWRLVKAFRGRTHSSGTHTVETTP